MNAINIFYTWTGHVLWLPGLFGQGHWHCGQVSSSQDLQPAYSSPALLNRNVFRSVVWILYWVLQVQP